MQGLTFAIASSSTIACALGEGEGFSTGGRGAMYI
jgi:hypothetical protein